MKKNYLIYFLFFSGLCVSVESQEPVFSFEYVNNTEIKYDHQKFLVDTNIIHKHDSTYLSIISRLTSTSIVSRCDRIDKFVFPIRVSVNGTTQIVSVTSAGLYALVYNKIKSISEYERVLYDYLSSDKVMAIDTIPIPYVGSANYITLSRLDPEVVVFGCDKWTFLNYFFRKSEDGTKYNYIGLDCQLTAVVLRLFSWGILVSDGCGSDQTSTIFIEEKNYPKNMTIPKQEDIEWIKKWMVEFGDKHILGDRLIDRTEWEKWRMDWWIL